MIDFQKYDGIDFAKQIAAKLEKQDSGRFSRLRGLLALECALAVDTVVHTILFSGKFLAMIALTLTKRVKVEELDLLSPRVNIIHAVDSLFRMVITPFLFVRYSDHFLDYIMKDNTIKIQLEELQTNLEQAKIEQSRLNLEICTKEAEMETLLDTHRKLLTHLRDLQDCFDDMENQLKGNTSFGAQISRNNNS